MQVTELEIVLFLWGVVMTWMWLRESQMHRGAKRLLSMMIEDKDTRDKIVSAYEEHVRRNT